jgi:UDP-glucose:(heptosyl)LPS alpha-1,3-glucosyltransferase
MQPRPHIAIATHKLPVISGKGRLVLENVRGLSERGWLVDVLAQEVDSERFRLAGADVTRVASPFLTREQRMRWLSWRALRHARKHNALLVGHGESLLEQDVLHIHNLLHRTHEAQRGTPLEPSAEGSSARIQRRIMTGRGFQHIIANSELVRADLIRRYGLNAAQVTVVHPGYDPERFHPAQPDDAELRDPLRKELGVAPGQFLVGLITSGDFEKRAVDAFLHSLARIPTAMRDRLHVVVAGKDRARVPYRDLVARSGMADRVHFVPPREDVETLYHGLDLYVHPAHFEEFGMSVIEAMACGIPTLTATQVGAAERVRGPARELLLTSPDPGLIAARIGLCLENPDCRTLLRDTGLAAARGCTWEDNVRGHTAVYERVLAARPMRPGARARGAHSR